MDYKYFITATLVDVGPRVFQKWCRVAGICISQNLAELLEKLEINSELAIQWFEGNYLNVNTGKCHLFIFGHKYKHQWAQIGENMVLGKTINNEFIFDSHILNICLKANKKFSVLCKLKNISAAKNTL